MMMMMTTTTMMMMIIIMNRMRPHRDLNEPKHRPRLHSLEMEQKIINKLVIDLPVLEPYVMLYIYIYMLGFTMFLFKFISTDFKKVSIERVELADDEIIEPAEIPPDHITLWKSTDNAFRGMIK